MSKILWSHASGPCLGRLGLFAVLLSAAVLPALPGTAAEKQANGNPTLEEALKSKAPEIRAFLWSKMNHPEKSLHVGVIKFLVQLGDQPPSDNAGPLNWYIARRLEAGLILTLDPRTEEAGTFRLLHIDSLRKELMGKANHLTPDGRKAFFQTDYAPAWGTEETIPAHMFVTGLVKIAKGGRTLEVEVLAFDSTGKDLVKVSCFKVAAEPRLLTEAGVSFALSRGSRRPKDNAEIVVAAGDRPELPPEAVVVLPNTEKPSEKPKEGDTIRGLLDQSPIDIQVLCKKEGEDAFRKVDIEENGAVPQPEEGTKVRFQFKRKKNTDSSAYGVLLMVNGKNTIYPEEQEPDPFRAHLWILDPKDDDRATLITGFLRKVDNKTAEFKVLPAAESRLMEVNYGPHAGTFTIVIFQGRIDVKEEPVRNESEFVRAISRGVPDKLGRATTLRSLQSKLRAGASGKPTSANVVGRGIIVGGDLIKQKVEDVPFQRYHTPVSSIQLRYYKPQGRD